MGSEQADQVGARLVATWEDVWEELPTDIPLALSSVQNESPEAVNASVFPDEVRSPYERKILKLLKADQSTHIDELVEMLENEMSSSEMFSRTFRIGTQPEGVSAAGEGFCEQLLAAGFCS